MRISGAGLDDFTQITRQISQLYDGNLTVCQNAHELPYARRPQCVARLAVVKSTGPGARRSSTGRRMPCACWHAYRDVLSAVFDAFPDAVIRTSMAVYRGHAGFTETYPETAYQNIGSELYPVTMPQLCECDDRTPTAGDDFTWADQSYAGPDLSYSEEYIQNALRHADETLRRVPA
jgi:hypothetical protein